MDFITALPPSNGKDVLWVIIDRLTKMGHFVAYHGTMNPKDLANQFLQQIIRPHRLPSSIVSDRESLFTSDFWKRVTEALGISWNLSTAFHQETDGQTERANATLEQYLRAYCNYQQDDWEKLLPIGEFCYNNTQNGTTRITPFLANYGYHPQFLPDLRTRNDETPEVSEYVAALRKLHEELRAEIKDAQMAQAEQAKNTRHPDPVIEPGDKVWLRRRNIRTTRPSNKLEHKQFGPGHTPSLRRWAHEHINWTCRPLSRSTQSSTSAFSNLQPAPSPSQDTNNHRHRPWSYKNSKSGK